MSVMNKIISHQKGFSPVISLIIIAVLAVAIYLVTTLGRSEDDFNLPPVPDGLTLLEDGTIVEADGTERKPDGTVVMPDGKIITQPDRIPEIPASTTEVIVQ